jgi:hypothetical protein
MLNARLTSCNDCGDISILLRLIDCKISEIVHSLYYNAIYALNNCVHQDIIADLLNYKRILLFRTCTPSYGGCISIQQIASRIRVLTAGCKPKCCDSCMDSIIN